MDNRHFKFALLSANASSKGWIGLPGGCAMNAERRELLRRLREAAAGAQIRRLRRSRGADRIVVATNGFETPADQPYADLVAAADNA